MDNCYINQSGIYIPNNLNDNKVILFDNETYKNIIDSINNKFIDIYNLSDEFYSEIIKTVNTALFNNLFFIINDNYDKVILSKDFDNTNENDIHLEILKDLLKVLKKSDLEITCIEDISIDYNTMKNNLNFILEYRPKCNEDFYTKIKEDLIAFGYIRNIDGVNINNEKDKYILPVYVDKKILESVEETVIENNYLSIAYLIMIEKIHDFLVNYYNLEFSHGLNNDIITVTLFNLFDAKISAYPKGLNKSLEVGKSIRGKCYFIDENFYNNKEINLDKNILMSLQCKDIFGKAPYIKYLKDDIK